MINKTTQTKVMYACLQKSDLVFKEGVF